MSHPPEFLPAREMTTLRSPRPRLAAAGGLAPPFADSKSAVLLVRRHRNEVVRTEGLAPPITRARGERVSCYTTSGWSSASVMLRAIPACRAGDFTGRLADEIGCRGGIRTCISPLNRRLLDWLSYPAMVGRHGFAP